MEGAHRFAVFAREVAMWITCGGRVERVLVRGRPMRPLSNELRSLASPDNWLQRIELYVFVVFLFEAAYLIQISAMRSNGRHRRRLR